MIHIQDGVKYNVIDDLLKGWEDKSPFKKPEWNGTSIIEGWTQSDQDAKDADKIKADKIKDYHNSDSTVWVGKTPNGLKDYAVVIDGNGKLQTIEII